MYTIPIFDLTWSKQYNTRACLPTSILRVPFIIHQSPTTCRPSDWCNRIGIIK